MLSKILVSALSLAAVTAGCTAPPEKEEAPLAASEPAPEPERPSDINLMDCLEIESTANGIVYTFTEGEASPAEVQIMLNYGDETFSEIAQRYTGSERDWLNKTAEISRQLSQYIEDGTGDGGLLLDQLGNNFELIEQFCG